MECGWLASGLLGIPDETRLSRQKLSYYVITREILAYKSMYNHLSRMAIVDEVRLNDIMEGKHLTIMLAASAMQKQHEHMKGALSLVG